MTVNWTSFYAPPKGIKERGNPDKRFCGESYDNMLESCPQRCRDGECPEGMVCFEDSPCVWEGLPPPGVVKKDASKMFCGKTWAQAIKCRAPCPSGSSDECEGEQQCYSDVDGCEKSTGKDADTDDSSNNDDQDDTDDDDDDDDDDNDNDDNDADGEVAASATNNPPEVQEKPKKSSPPPPTPPAPVIVASKPSAFEGNPFEDDMKSLSSEDDPIEVMIEESSQAGIITEHLRIALYGLEQLTSNHVEEWEIITRNYIEHSYNSPSKTDDFISGSINHVAVIIDVTEVDLSPAQRRRWLKTDQKNTFKRSAFLLTYTQTTRYDTKNKIGLDKMLQHPFSGPTKRARYVKYLKEGRANSKTLFGKLTSVSPVFLPHELQSNVSILNKKGLSSDGAGTKYTSFYCPASGTPCPTGKCYEDSCQFKTDGRPKTPASPYIPSAAAPSSSEITTASSLVGLALGGSRPSKIILSSPTAQPVPSTTGLGPSPKASMCSVW